MLPKIKNNSFGHCFMKEALRHRNQPITFRQWSRKNYAIFSSLGKEVNIGHVDIDICNKAFNKSPKIDITLNQTTEDLQYKNDDEDVLLSENVNIQTISLLSFTTNLDNSSRHSRRLTNKYISNYLTNFLFGELELLYKIFKNEKSI